MNNGIEKFEAIKGCEYFLVFEEGSGESAEKFLKHFIEMRNTINELIKTLDEGCEIVPDGIIHAGLKCVAEKVK